MLSNIELLGPFALAAYTLWSTPGPNNMMLAYSGARFGLKATLPHILGILAGTCLLNLAALVGLQPLIQQWPVLLTVLKLVGTVWLVYIGWKMATAQIDNVDAKTSAQQPQARPMSFTAAALFQFANPKAITATLALASLILVSIEHNPALLLVVFLLIPPLAFVAITPWALAGQAIRRFLSTSLRWRIFTWLSGGLTAGCAFFLWL